MVNISRFWDIRYLRPCLGTEFLFVPYVALGIRVAGPVRKDDVGRIQCGRGKILAHSHLTADFCKPRVTCATPQHLPL